MLVFVTVLGLSPAAASRGRSPAVSMGFSLRWRLLCRAQAPGTRASVVQHAVSGVVAHRLLSCPLASGIFSDQWWDPCPLPWQADSYLLDHQGSSQRHSLILSLWNQNGTYLHIAFGCLIFFALIPPPMTLFLVTYFFFFSSFFPSFLPPIPPSPLFPPSLPFFFLFSPRNQGIYFIMVIFFLSFFFFLPYCVTWKTLVSWLWMEPTPHPPQWKYGVLTNGPPRNSSHRSVFA